VTACPTPLPTRALGYTRAIHRAPIRRPTAGLRLNGMVRTVLRVGDLGASLRFFGDVLGLPVTLRQGGEVVVSAGATELELRQHAGPGPAVRGPASADLATLEAADPTQLHDLVGRLVAAQVPHTGVRTSDQSGRRYVRFVDPDGRPWEVTA
jgi:catechol 2,3-dioxygenase-like lactoylglutathione lyase family enzyme